MQRNQRWPSPGWLLMPILLAASCAWARPQFKILHSFPNNDGKDGNGPTGSIVLDPVGNLYSTTEEGGAYGGCGTVFKMTPDAYDAWTESVLHSFNQSIDGCYPGPGLTFDAHGNLYGTTSSGMGTNDGGTAFEMTPDSISPSGWTTTVIHRFCHNFHGCKDGSDPDLSGVVVDSVGRLYGTTRNDGSTQGGVAYRLTPTNQGWKEVILYTFCSPNCSDGDRAAGSTPILDKAGNLYGTAQEGGLSNCSVGCGLVFELKHSAAGWQEAILYAFHGDDGEHPVGGLVFDSQGNLYGTTQEGGKNGSGTAFKLEPEADGTWKEIILYDFPHITNGSGPVSTLMLDKAGNLYGTAAGGIGPCSGGCGVVYKLAPGANGKWKYSVLHRFTDAKNDGAEPYATPIFDKTGKHLYGTTAFGGTDNVGVVYEITP
jgi:uncharacterized repeat protein (TIGR03803 family)